ncbi:hypothetical protein BP5796_03730 [Coleophoma crateriformis]|uniref:Uncharacterized protein n=1 Tax=Coleophoma crateriformis TaxID=565419 RepID=A0A3D8SGD9_9HELO|nr:hypothetical protein BP5796_03730 [Coleophoma crateriformis]
MMNLYQSLWMALAIILSTYSAAMGLILGVLSCLATDRKTSLRPFLPTLLILTFFWTDVFCDQWALIYYYIGVIVGAFNLPTTYGDPCAGFYPVGEAQEITEDFYRAAKCDGRVDGTWYFKEDIILFTQLLSVATACLLLCLFFFQAATTSLFQALVKTCAALIKLPVLVSGWTRSTYDNVVDPTIKLARLLFSGLELLFGLLSNLIQWATRRLSESCAHAKSCRCFKDLIPADSHKSLQANFNRLSLQLDSERELLQTYENRASKAHGELDSMRNQLTQLQGQLASARQSVPVPAPLAATQRIAELETQVFTMGQRIADFESEIPSKTLRITQLESEIKAKLVRISDLEAGNPSKDLLISDLSSDIRQKTETIAQMDLRLREMTDQMSALHEVIHQNDNDISSKTSLMASWEQQASAVFDDLNQKGRYVEKQRDDAVAEASQWKQMYESLMGRVQELEAALQAQHSLSALVPAATQAQPMHPAAAQIPPVVTSARGFAPGSSSLSRDVGDFAPGPSSRSAVAGISAPGISSRSGVAESATGGDQSLVVAQGPAALPSPMPSFPFTFSVAFGGASQVPPAVEEATAPDEGVEDQPNNDLHEFAEVSGDAHFENPRSRQLMDISTMVGNIRGIERVMQRDQVDGSEDTWTCWNSEHCTEQPGELTLSELSTMLISHQAFLQNYLGPEVSLAWETPEEEAFCYCSNCRGETEPVEVEGGEYSLEKLLLGNYQEKSEEW